MQTLIFLLENKKRLSQLVEFTSCTILLNNSVNFFYQYLTEGLLVITLNLFEIIVSLA